MTEMYQYAHSTPEIVVKWTPQENTCYHYFFLMPNCHMAFLKWEFGIGLRDKQKLNFEWETERYMGTRGATYDQWLNKHQSWSWLGQGMEGKAVTAGQRCVIPILMLSVARTNDEWSDDAMPMLDLCSYWWDGELTVVVNLVKCFFIFFHGVH